MARTHDWDVYAVDGHYHKAACFDPKRLASDGTVRATATGHFFRMNMRTHHLSCRAMAEPKDGRKKEHDMADIKRSTAEYIDAPWSKSLARLRKLWTLPAA